MTAKKRIGLILLIAAGIIMQAAVLFGIPVLFRLSAKVEVYDDPARYEEFRAGADRDGKNKWHKWSMDESIWPEKIPEGMEPADFKMVYYNPWDAQYLGYLVTDCSPGVFAAETERLRNYPSTEYRGYYGTTGEEKTYELLAVNADPYQGFVYALTDNKSRIIYAEEIFCNYFMDLDYPEYIPEEYLLDGFDASPDNPYRKKMMGE